MTLLLNSFPARADVWKRVFAEAGEPLLTDPTDIADPAEVTVLTCWKPPADLSVYPNLRVVLSVGAGVDQMPLLPPQITLCRALAPGIEAMVRDWAVMACLMLHRDMPAYLEHARANLWKGLPVPSARKRRIGVLGLGRTGQMTAQSLAALGFPVMGWSRTGPAVDGIEVYAGDALPEMLRQSDILVCLLPLTPQTKGFLNDQLFANLPEGAHLVHAGRGAQLDMGALYTALETGQLASAMLDVTNPEPLPSDHWAWSDPRVIVTPHIAAATDAEEGARHALAILSALRAGQPLPGAVDQAKGY